MGQILAQKYGRSTKSVSFTYGVLTPCTTSKMPGSGGGDVIKPKRYGLCALHYNFVVKSLWIPTVPGGLELGLCSRDRTFFQEVSVKLKSNYKLKHRDKEWNAALIEKIWCSIPGRPMSKRFDVLRGVQKGALWHSCARISVFRKTARHVSDIG